MAMGSAALMGVGFPPRKQPFFSTAFTSEKALGRVQVPHEMFVKYL